MAPTSPFTHLIVEEVPAELPSSWRVVDAVPIWSGGFKVAIELTGLRNAAIKFDYETLAAELEGMLTVRKRDALWILERI